ncbi:MAG: hypothetical protein A2X22_12480 [Bacteroidetes bacterium GWF2_49_14]|nr:MAG: hypothetical protein A2X22_12480 [Bacteroidetes bacterium GWF2_49_14]HBB93487.1 hypothetical protein [Bacteroidales bacterium]
MELDNAKGTFLAKLILIHIPVALLLGTGILALFLIIHTWLPVIISGLLVILGWLVTVILRLMFVRLRISEDSITVMYYPIRILSSNYKKIEIRKDQFAGGEISGKMGGLRTILLLYEDASGTNAAYPPVTISLFSAKDLKKIKTTFPRTPR